MTVQFNVRQILRKSGSRTRSRLSFVARSHIDNPSSSRFLRSHAVNSQSLTRSTLTFPRSHVDNPLNLTPFDISKNIETKESIYKIPNLQTTRLINDFFQSILSNNFNLSRLVLYKIGTKINLNYFHTSESNLLTNQVNNYYSCLLLLLTNSIFLQDSILIQNIKLLIEDFQLVEKKLDGIPLPNEVRQLKKEIDLKFVICLMFCFSKSNQMYKSPVNVKMIQKSMATYIMRIMTEFQIDPNDIKKEILLNPKLQCLLDQFVELCNLNKVRINFEDISVEKRPQFDEYVCDQVSIEDYKDMNGFVNFDRLCQYISDTRFSKWGTSKKLYEIYDSLNTNQKNDFMTEYRQINNFRELNVENHCLDLVEDFDSIHTQNKAQVKHNYTTLSKFKKSHEAILFQWLSNNLKSLNTITTKFKKEIDPKSLNDIELELEKYRIHLTVMPKNALVTMLLSTLLSKTISAKEGYTTLVEISRDLTLSFTRLISRETSYKPIKLQLLKFFYNDDGLKLFSVLIKMCLENCSIKISETSLNALQESLSYMNESIDKEFLKKDEKGEYKAFTYSLIRKEKGSVKVTGVIKIHPYLFHEFKAYNSLAFNKSIYLPMLSVPKPWISPTQGGYLNDLKPIVSTNDIQTSLAYLDKAHATGQMQSLYTSLNNLSSNAWAINSRVMEVLNETMQMDQGFLKIPPNLKTLKATTHEDYHNLKNLRLEYNMIQSVANSLEVNGDIFYLPHCVDFRGRAYPMVSILSHYQEDVVRAIMMFWYSKPLGPNGLNWIKYQLAGCFGKDKLSMDDRITFVHENMVSILDSSQRPLEGSMWWKRGDKPWQTLSLCMELDRILKFQLSGGKVEEYLCRIPIHQDGSCNGLQHYAALGADEEGGRSVNLIPLPNNEKGDIYTKVLKIVKEKVVLDIKKDPTNQIAIIANEILSRKLVKQTIMTTVYGVTVYGGAAQISARIKDIIQDLEQTNPNSQVLKLLKDDTKKLSFYLSTLVLDSISDLFAGAKRIQDWLVENCLRVITSFDMQTIQHIQKLLPEKNFSFFDTHSYKPMMWTSISGFPVVQLYKHTKQVSIPTSLQRITIMKPQKLAPINKRKQLNAIAPNFVHSLDSLHMFMSSVAAIQHKIGFASVHDSFWTYPSDVEELSRILRQEFVRLHTSDIIEQLREDLVYSTSESFQLLWIHNEHSDLVKEIREVRASYPIWNKNDNLKSKRNLDKLLFYELEGVSKGQPNLISQLVNKHNPVLYSRHHNSSQYLETYKTKVEEHSDQVFKSSLSKFTPVLLPVRILDSPKTGKLDINQVMKSTYFFS
jgi:DNA-directed RNA polymerase